MISRRSLITGLISFAAAPAIVRAGSLMPVKVMLDAEAKVAATTYYFDNMVFTLLYDGQIFSWGKGCDPTSWSLNESMRKAMFGDSECHPNL